MHVLGGLKLTIPKDHDYWATESEEQDAPSTGSGVGGSGPISSVPVAFEKSAPTDSPASGAPAAGDGGDGGDEGVKVGGFGLSRHRTPAGHDYWATPGDGESGGAHSAPEEVPAARHAEPEVDYATPRPSLFEPPAPSYAEPEPLFADLDSRYDRSEMYAERGAGYGEPDPDDRFGDDGYHPLVSGDETAIVREAAYEERAETELQVEFPSPRTRATNERAPARRSELDRGRVPKPVIIGTAAALALVLLGGLFWLAWPSDDPPRKPPSAGAGLPAPDGGAAGNGASSSDDPTSAPPETGTSAPAPGATTTTARPPGTRPPATPTPTPTPTQTTPSPPPPSSNPPSVSPSETSSSSGSALPAP